jgi:hypothetical protein
MDTELNTAIDDLRDMYAIAVRRPPGGSDCRRHPRLRFPARSSKARHSELSVPDVVDAG